MCCASQAFDKVNYIKLFRLLLKKNINPLVVRCLLYMYTNQHLNVSWKCHMSSYFKCSNGVKQGGVLSPILFGIYVDELLCRLKQSGFGCRIGHVYYGALGYADDIALIAPTKYSLHMMCKLSLEFANEYDIKFNPLKCEYMNYNNENDSFLFDDILLDSRKKCQHLGHNIGRNICNDESKEASGILIRNVNMIINNFNKGSYQIKVKLFNAFCTSYYGCPLWNNTDKSISLFFTTWRKSIRKLLNLPPRTHCNLLPAIMDSKPIECQLLCRFF